MFAVDEGCGDDTAASIRREEGFYGTPSHVCITLPSRHHYNAFCSFFFVERLISWNRPSSCATNTKTLQKKFNATLFVRGWNPPTCRCADTIPHAMQLTYIRCCGYSASEGGAPLVYRFVLRSTYIAKKVNTSYGLPPESQTEKKGGALTSSMSLKKASIAGIRSRSTSSAFRTFAICSDSAADTEAT